MFQAVPALPHRGNFLTVFAETGRYWHSSARLRGSGHGLFPQLNSGVRVAGKQRPSSPSFPQSTRNRRYFRSMAESQSWWSGKSQTLEEGNPVSFESNPMEVPQETPSDIEQLPTRRVHLLGLGSIGTLVAHSLKCLPNPPPMTLLMHRKEMYDTFKEDGRTIRLINSKTEVNDEQRGFDVDILEENEDTGFPYWRHIPDTPRRGAEPANRVKEDEWTDSGEVYIYTLIVSVKGPATVNALAAVKHRVNSQTTICFMQNGMGQIEELNRHVFTDPETRPTYMLGIVSHGSYMRNKFTVVHAGFGSTALGIWRDTDRYPLPPKSSSLNMGDFSSADRDKFFPTDEALYSNLSSRYLLRTLTRSPVLACASYPYLDLVQLQLEKLAMNAILNPLTAILDVLNGNTVGNVHLKSVRRLLLAEISLVIQGLPELEGIPGVKLRFSASRLETLVTRVTNKTARNSSSMREDIRNLRETEIEYINGYIVRRGEEQGVKCVLNYMLMQLVQAKSLHSREEKAPKPHGISMVENVAFGSDRSSVVLEDKDK